LASDAGTPPAASAFSATTGAAPSAGLSPPSSSPAASAAAILSLSLSSYSFLIS